MMQDGRALQVGTSHLLGPNFARGFKIQFTDDQNRLQYPSLTSWGVSTRLVGGLIMTHGDDQGLVLPPALAPVQVVIIPMGDAEEGRAVQMRTDGIVKELRARGCRVESDRQHHTLGEKHFFWEKKGVPIRIELGPRDLQEDRAVMIRRDQKGKTSIALDALAGTVVSLLVEIQEALFQKAQGRLQDRTQITDSYDAFKEKIKQGGFFLVPWCGQAACEERVKEETGATNRCVPFDGSDTDAACLVCGREARRRALFALSY
jgi:prolyl-tRNA synthetase